MPRHSAEPTTNAVREAPGYGQHEGELPFHPLADIFPLLDGPEFDALAADIREHGLREAIVLHEGQILDGRNRYRAARAAGIDTADRFEAFTGNDTLAFVVSKNLHRRHLNETQRGLIAAQIANMESGDPEKQRHGGQICPPVPLNQAAEMLNVSRRTAVNARTVIREGTPDELAAARNGEIAVGTLAQDIRNGIPPDRRGKNRPPSQTPRGTRIAPRDDRSVEEIAREGLRLQEAGSTANEICKAIGVNGSTWAMMRDVVSLAERTDLSTRETAIARDALVAMNESRQAAHAHETVAPIVRRLWGASENRRATTPTRAEERRGEAFDRAYGIIIEVCTTAGRIEVPHLTKERAAELAAELRAAARSIHALCQRILEIHQ